LAFIKILKFFSLLTYKILCAKTVFLRFLCASEGNTEVMPKLKET